MFDDGSHNDSLAADHIYGAKIIPDGDIIQYYVYAENDSAGIFSPERAEYEYYSIQPQIDKGDIIINENGEDNHGITQRAGGESLFHQERSAGEPGQGEPA
jgi:hypothetical protein